MNLILLHDEDFIDATRVRLGGRRLEHVRLVHRAEPGKQLVVGRLGGRIGRGTVMHIGPDALEMEVHLDQPPPDPIPLTLVLAVPRPKVLNRVVAGAASLGIKRIFLVNAWKVEKSYWKSPRMTEENLRAQCALGLEQAGDTVLPAVELRRFFRRFVEEELPAVAAGTLALLAHPGAAVACPRDPASPVTLVVGPEGGFIPEELASLQRAGFLPVALGARILRVETAVPVLVGRMF